MSIEKQLKEKYDSLEIQSGYHAFLEGFNFSQRMRKEDYRLSVYKQMEIDSLRKALVLWQGISEAPSWVKKELLNAEAIRNEIIRIETGKVK